MNNAISNRATASGPRPPVARSAPSAPSFILAALMHGLLLGGMWLAVQWKTAPEAAAVAELWGALPAIAAPPVEPVPPPVAAPAPPPPPPPEERPAEIVEKQEKAPPPKPEKKLEEPKKIEPAKDERKLEADKRRREEEKRAQDAERRREQELARISGQVQNPSATAGTVARQGSGDATYATLLSSLIKPNIAFAVPDGTSTEVFAEFAVELLPSGEVTQVRVVRPSGLPGYDEAVGRAIRRTNVFPKRKDGTVPSTLTLIFRPVER